MKFFKSIAATVCALAVTAAAHPYAYFDSAANYDLNHTLATGDNGGDGFGAWEIESHDGSGDGWAGCGIWDPSANDFQGDWAGKKQAFGIIGKGDGYGVNAFRPFRAPLAVGDSFSLEMGVNWDGNGGIDSLKGFALLAGDLQVLTINHRSNPGVIAINGETDDILNIDSGTYPMTWTFTAKDATTVTVTMTPRDGSKTVYEKDWEVGSSAIDGFRLQSSGQNPYEDKQAAEAQGENEQMWADRRQTYFDNFTLETAEELPELVALNFDSGDWNVTSASQDVVYTLSRASSVGALTVNVKSSFEAFIPSTTVSFEDGQSTVTFTNTATLQPYAFNKADLTATATGCNPAVFQNVRGPALRRSVQDDQKKFFPGADPCNFWVNWDKDGFDIDLSKITVTCDPEDSVTLPEALEWTTEEGGAYAASSFTAVSTGKIYFQFDGVTFADWDVTVLSAEIQFADGSRTALKTDTPCEYTVYGTLIDGAVTVAITGEATGTATPDEFELFDEASFSVTFTTPGSATITVSDGNGHEDSIGVTVSAPVDPSDFDDYIAYDEASLYDDAFDASSTGAGSVGFAPWTVVNSSATFGDTLVYGQDAGFPDILSAGSAFGIYGNGGDDPNYSILRPFADGASLEPGQQISVEFVASEAGGSRSVIFARIWEGVPYSRFEIWNDGGNIGVNVNGAASASLGWPAGARRVVATVQFDPDGSAYTLKLIGYTADSEVSDGPWMHVVDVNVGEWYDGIQGVQFRAGNTEGDLVFNRLALEKFADPVVTRAIGWGEGDYNPEGDGDYSITLTATTDDIGPVAVSVIPGDDNVGTIELASDTVTFDENKTAVISFTLTGVQPGDTFKIAAVPEDTTVEPLEGDGEHGAYGVTVIASYLTLWCNDGGDFTTDTKEIWLSLSASPSKYGTYQLQTSDSNVIALSVDSLTLPTDEGSGTAWFNVYVKGVGTATVSIKGEDANWEFHISEGSDPSAKILPITAMEIEDGSMKLTVDGQPAAVYGATEIVDGDWAWQAMELVVEDNPIAIPMSVPFMVIKVEK